MLHQVGVFVRMNYCSAEEDVDYIHCNALAVDPADGNILLSCRHYNHVAKIARHETVFNGQTFAVGDVVWKLGGKNNRFEFVNDDNRNGDPGDLFGPGFAHQHCVSVTATGTILLFDNGNLYASQAGPWKGYSRAVEYRLDTENMTATRVWSYDIGAKSYFCGSVQRLENGNTVVGWGGQTAYGAPGTAAYTEVTPNGVKWLEFAMYPVELSYRVFRFTRSDQGEWTECLGTLGENFPPAQ